MENLCRICLQEGAHIPIFEYKDDENNVNSKLSLCVKEKVEDIEGYPRNICSACSNALDTACQFVKKYKESCKILESGLVSIKQENHFSDSCNEQSEVEIDIIDLKTEKDLVLEPSHLDADDPVKKIEKLKNLSIRKISSKKRPPPTNETSTVATSILEGAFKWNGESIKPDPELPPLLPIKDLSHKNKKLKLLKKQKELKKRKLKKKPINSQPVIKPTKESKPSKLCDLCGDVFNSTDQLSYHKKKKHDEPAKCSTCGRICSSQYYLKRHMKRKHSERKDFVCSICGKSFAFNGELSSHYKSVHIKKTGPPKIFACSICGKTYKCKKSVVVHERAVHTGERPAVCSVCDTSFTHEDYLKEHMRLHTGETPFKCPICGRGYAQRCNMKSHLRIHRVSELDAAKLSELRPNYLRRLKV